MSKQNAPPGQFDAESDLSLGELHDELIREVQDTVYPPGRRVQISLACFCVARDHHYAIAAMLEERRFASVFALLRPIFEATVKGSWLAHCGTDSDAERLYTGKELSQVGDLLDQLLVSPLPPLLSQALKDIKVRYWRTLSSFAHAGSSQVRRWVKPEGVGPIYSDEELQEATNFTAFMAVVASLESARLGNNEKAISVLSMRLAQVESH